MVCNTPDPPDSSSQELSPPPAHELRITRDDSDSEEDYVGYEPLPQGPEGLLPERNDSDMEEDDNSGPPDNLPPLEPMETVLSKEVWNAPRKVDTIQMNDEKVHQILSAMSNFVLPTSSLPEWAKTEAVDNLKKIINDKVEKMKNDTST